MREKEIRQARHDRDEFLEGLSPTKLLRETLKPGEEPYNREEFLDPRKIIIEDVIDEDRAMLLGGIVLGDIKKGLQRGYKHGKQSSLINLAAYFDKEGKLACESWDGSHRIWGVVKQYKEYGFKEPPKLRCAIDYGLTEYEILMKKISAGTSIKGIKFVRLVSWINKAFSLTPFASKYHLSADQAFTMTVFKSSGKELVGNEADATAIKQWCRDITTLSGGNLGTIFDYLLLAKISDKDVLKRVRIGGAFQKGQYSITIKQMRIIAEGFHNDQYPDFQDVIARFANSRSLGSEKILQAVRYLQEKRPKTVEDVSRLLQSEDWEDFSIDFPTTRNKNRSEPAIREGTFAALDQILAGLNLPAEAKQFAQGLGHALKGIVLEQKIDPRGKEDRDFIDSFLNRWVHDKANLRKLLLNDNEAQVEFTEVLKRLRREQAYQLSLNLLPFLFFRDVDQRDIVTNIFHSLPLEKFDSTQVGATLTILSADILKFVATTSGPDETGEILETLMETLEKISRVKTSSPNDWNNLLSIVELTSKSSTDKIRAQVKEFKTKHFLSQELQKGSSVTIFKG